MTAAGLIFSNIHDESLRELTARRTMASVPFGGRYRLIDFPLSCMVNAGISKVGIVAHNNYQSLLDHIGSGKDWDLARRSGGIKILPPLITAYDNAVAGKVYETRLEALMGVTNFIERCTEDCIILSDSNAVYNIDLKKVLRAHEKSGAVVTFVTKEIPADECPKHKDVKVMEADENGRLTGCSVFEPLNHTGMIEIYTDVAVFDRQYLLASVRDAIARGYRSFFHDIICRCLKEDVYGVYRYEGFYDMIVSLRGYFACNMKVLAQNVRHDLLGEPARPIYTKVRNSTPTVYAEGARVKNSLVAEGCQIEGVVENSVIFRGVHVGKGTVVRNSILLQDTQVGDNTLLNCVVTDKNVIIRDGRMLSGDSTLPFYIGKGKMI